MLLNGEDTLTCLVMKVQESIEGLR
jgi:hypothetical protein